MPLDPKVLALLVCPACRTGLREIEDGRRLLCGGCSRAFPVRGGIPVLAMSESEPAPKK